MEWWEKKPNCDSIYIDLMDLSGFYAQIVIIK